MSHYDYINAMKQEGAGLYQLTVKDGKRHSAAAAFLLPILQRPNLTTITGALVTRLLLVPSCSHRLDMSVLARDSQVQPL